MILRSTFIFCFVLSAQPGWASDSVFTSRSSDGSVVFSDAPVVDGSLERQSYKSYTGRAIATASCAGATHETLRRRFNHLSASISESAQINKLDPLLIKAIARVESCFDKSAVSSAGAQGVMQLMPMTAASLGVSDSFDVSQNIHGGSTYFAQMLNRYQGDIKLALAAYNAGPGSVDRFNDIPPFPETQKYVVRVLNTYRSYLGLNRTSSRAL